MSDLLTDDPKDAEKAADDYRRELTAAILATLLLLRPRVSRLSVWGIPAGGWRDFSDSMRGAVAPIFDAHDAAARLLYAPFDSLDPAVVSGQRDMRSSFVKQFTASTQDATNAVLQLAKSAGLPIEEAAKLLGIMAGANKRQAGSLWLKWLQMKEAGASESAIAKALQKLADRALKDRAKTTAETELWNAVQIGRESAAKQAERRSNEAVQVRKFWEVSEDERLCPVCAAIPGMNPDGVPVGEPFRTPVGPRMAPTIHPKCRCGTRFETVSPGQF